MLNNLEWMMTYKTRKKNWQVKIQAYITLIVSIDDILTFKIVSSTITPDAITWSLISANCKTRLETILNIRSDYVRNTVQDYIQDRYSEGTRKEQFESYTLRRVCAIVVQTSKFKLASRYRNDNAFDVSDASYGSYVASANWQSSRADAREDAAAATDERDDESDEVWDCWRY